VRENVANEDYERLREALAFAAAEEREFASALSQLGGKQMKSRLYDPADQLRWLAVRALRLAYRVDARAVAEAALRAMGGGLKPLPPPYKLWTPTGLELVRRALIEAHPNSWAQWAEEQRQLASLALLAKPAPALDENRYVPVYLRRIKSVRRRQLLRSRYGKPFRNNFWRAG
jgi:hypothetical protein